MTPGPDPQHVPPVPPMPSEAPPRESLPQMLMSLLGELPKLVSDRVELLSLDLERAALALGQIVGLIVGLAILGVTAWLLLWGGILLGLVMLGLPTWGALLLGIVINAIAIWVVVSRLKSLVPSLLLKSFRKHLALTPVPPRPSEVADAAEAATPPASDGMKAAHV